MRRTGLRLLALVLALLLVAPAALAKEISIYGNGSKTSYDIADKYGKTYHYYDAFNGALKRQDSADSSRFLRLILSSNFKGQVNRTQRELWDVYGLDDFSVANDLDLTLDGRNAYNSYMELSSYWASTNSGLLESRGMAETELAIREKFAQMCRDEMGDKHIKADHFKEIAGLKNIPYKGTTFSTIRAAGKKGSRVMAVGSIFYDFRFRYLEDGKVADSAVGAEKDINKVKGKRGVKADDGAFTRAETSWVENGSKYDAERTVSFSKTHETRMENSVSHTDETHADWMVGAEVKTTWKIPLIGETEITVKGEYTSGWMSSTTKGKSKSVAESQTYSDSVTTKVPARSKAEGQLLKADGSYSIEYDYPIAVTFKVAQYAIMDDRKSSLFAIWGEMGDEGNSFAQQNLFNRFDHKGDDGYEKIHSSGFPIKWSAISSHPEMSQVLMTYIPMSVTGGTISMSGSRFKIKVGDPIPMDKMSALNLDGPSTIKMAAEGELDLTANAPVVALQDYAEADVPFYGFDDEKDGVWFLCDKDGKETDSELATLSLKDGHYILSAGKQTGELFVKFRLREDVNYQIAEGEGQETVLVERPYENDGVANNTLLKVRVQSPLEGFNGTVKASGPVEAVVGQPLDLVREGPDVKCYDAADKEVSLEYPPVWSVAGGNNDNIAVAHNVLTAHKAGDYKLLVTVGSAVSDPIDLILGAGDPVTGVEIDLADTTLDKGAEIRFKATVLPSTAGNKNVTWHSTNERVATVDQNGRVKGVGTGLAVIVVTTQEGGFTASREVKVQVATDGEALDIGNLALVKGKSYKLGTPGGASGTWAVADPAIATVNDAGKVTGNELGETVLRFTVLSAKAGAKYLGKAVSAGDVIEVPLGVRKKGDVATKVILGDKKLTLAPGGSYVVTAALKPAKVSDPQVYFKTSNKSVALVDDDGVITGVGNGKATITATSASGKSAKVTVTVTNAVGKITLNAKKQKLVAGEVFKLIATPVPSDIENFAPVFESSKPGVATVDTEGNITAVAKGKATITVYAAPGSKIKAKCVVTVS